MFNRPNYARPGKSVSTGSSPEGLFHAIVTRSTTPRTVGSYNDAIIGTPGQQPLGVDPGSVKLRVGAATDAVVGSVRQNQPEARVYVKVPRLFGTFEYGPVEYVGAAPSPGDRIFVAFKEGRQDELVAITGIGFTAEEEVVATGGGVVPTYLIAASDARQEVIDAADYVCTGTSDEVVFQQAMDALGATGAPGGRLVASEGTFVFSDGFSSYGDFERGLIIEGMGINATIFKFVGGTSTYAIDMMDPGVILRNFSVHVMNGSSFGTAVIAFSSVTGICENVSVYIDSALAVGDVPSNGFFWDGTPTSEATTDGIEHQTISRAIGCQVEYMGAKSAFNCFLIEHSFSVFTACETWLNTTTPYNNSGFETSASHVKFVDCKTSGGAFGISTPYNQSGSGNSITACHLRPIQAGVYVAGSHRSWLIRGNLFDNVYVENSTAWSAIYFSQAESGICRGCFVTGNTCLDNGNPWLYMVSTHSNETISVGNAWHETGCYSVANTPHDTTRILPTEYWPAGGVGQGDNFIVPGQAPIHETSILAPTTITTFTQAGSWEIVPGTLTAWTHGGTNRDLVIQVWGQGHFVEDVESTVQCGLRVQVSIDGGSTWSDTWPYRGVALETYVGVTQVFKAGLSPFTRVAATATGDVQARLLYFTNHLNLNSLGGMQIMATVTS